MKTSIGIDLGGTKIKACLADVNGNVLAETQVSTKAEAGREAVLTQLDEIVESLILPDTVGGGIGSPGIVDTIKNQVVEFGFNIEGWHKAFLTKRLEAKYPNLCWYAENDANCAALGEYWMGAGRGLSSFIMITLGTGVGGAIFSQKTGIHHGFYQEAGEMGHMIFQPDGRPCNCGQNGCIEQYISGASLKRIYKERTGSLPKGSIFALIDHDEDAKIVVDDFIKHLALYLISLKQSFDPEAFLIGGGLIHEKSIWWDRFIDTLQKNISFHAKTKFLAAQKLNEAGMLGAAYLAFQNGDENGSENTIG